MNNTLETALAIAGLAVLGWVGIWTLLGTFNAIAQGGNTTTLTFRGFFANFFFACLAGAGIIVLVRVLS